MAIAVSTGGSGRKHIDVFEHLDQLWNFDPVQSGNRNYAHSACLIRGSGSVGEVENFTKDIGFI